MKKILQPLLHTPQSQPLPGSGQTPNHAGGFGWTVDDWTRLDRFLVLGSEAGTFYVGTSTLTRENASAVVRCIEADGLEVVRRVVDVSEGGRAPKNDPAVFVLGLCLKLGDEPTRAAAAAAVPRVCRIGTHLFGLAATVSAVGGWGRATKRTFARWYTDRDPAALAHDVTKYQARDGWSHRDVLRLAKPAGHDPTTPHGAIFQWITKGWSEVADAPPEAAHLRRLWAFERAKTADAATCVRLITDERLPRECIPTQHLNSPAVWGALLRSGDGMPLTAMLRNLGKMGEVGLLTPLSEAAAFVQARLGDADALRRARVHPLTLLSAQLVYAEGHGVRGSLSWTPVGAVVDALDAAFYTAFTNVPATGQRLCLAVDVSGSMACTKVNGLPNLPACTAAAALALVTASVEPQHQLIAFDDRLKALPITPGMRLAEARSVVEKLVSGGTDCALPMLDAAKKQTPVDAFVVLTDSESWQGEVHASVALQRHRDATGIRSKLAVMAMCSNHTSIADPDDGGMLNVVGFDAAVPEVLAAFIRS